MQVYWSKILVLPTKLIVMIRSTMMRFLWKGKNEGRYHAPIAFNKIEKPISKGVLGVLNLKHLNRVAIIKHANDFLNDKDSIWVQWSKHNFIKNNSFWTMNKPQRISWTWRSIFKLRGAFLPICSYNITQGSRVQFWDEP